MYLQSLQDHRQEDLRTRDDGGVLFCNPHVRSAAVDHTFVLSSCAFIAGVTGPCRQACEWRVKEQI